MRTQQEVCCSIVVHCSDAKPLGECSDGFDASAATRKIVDSLYAIPRVVVDLVSYRSTCWNTATPLLCLW